MIFLYSVQYAEYFYYPVEDKAHAANAKARATQMVNKGKLSSSEASKIKAKANKVLKGSKKK